MGSTYFTADKHFWTILLVILFRYVFLASLGFLLYYVIFRKKVFSVSCTSAGHCHFSVVYDGL